MSNYIIAIEFDQFNDAFAILEDAPENETINEELRSYFEEWIAENSEELVEELDNPAAGKLVLLDGGLHSVFYYWLSDIKKIQERNHE